MSVGESLNAESARRALWTALPTGVFIRLDTLSAFRRSHHLTILKTRELIPGVPVLDREVGPVGHCRLSIVTCGTVPCAYAITSAYCPVRIRPSYCCWTARGDPAPSSALLYSDGTLSVVGGESAVIAFMRHRNWIG